MPGGGMRSPCCQCTELLHISTHTQSPIDQANVPYKLSNSFTATSGNTCFSNKLSFSPLGKLLPATNVSYASGQAVTGTTRLAKQGLGVSVL